MHVAETIGRAEGCREKNGFTTVEWLWNLGVLGPDVLLAHSVWVSEKEIALLASTKTKVVHNPVANQYLGDGAAPVRRMLDQGVTVALGTDGAGSNNGQDIFEAMKSAVLLQRVSHLNSGALNSEKVLEMATIDAARAVGMEDQIGSLEPGKRADLVLVDMEVPQLVPSVSALSNLVYAAPSRAVNLVMVDGRTVFKDGVVTALDMKRLITLCNETANSMVHQGGVSHLLNRGSWKMV